jgi:hypothetical protein
MSERQWFSDKCKTRHALRILSPVPVRELLKKPPSQNHNYYYYYTWDNKYAKRSAILLLEIRIYFIPGNSMHFHRHTHMIWRVLPRATAHRPQPLARSHWTHARPPAPPTCQLLHWSFEIDKQPPDGDAHAFPRARELEISMAINTPYYFF